MSVRPTGRGAPYQTGRMQTDILLDRFLGALAPLDPVAVWAHGSLMRR